MTPSLEQLWDIEQIKQLKARYFRLLDTKDWDAFADRFTDDCPHDLPQEPAKEAVSNQEYFADPRKGSDGTWRISSKRNVRLRLDQLPLPVPSGQNGG